VLRQSWCVSQLSQTEIADALTICRLTGTNESVSQKLASRVGPPMFSLSDPRLEYMDEEGDLWREIVAFPAGTEAERFVCLPVFQDVDGKDAMRLAAESSEDFARVSVLKILPQRLLVHLFARPRERSLLLVVTDPKGELTRGLDGTSVSFRDAGLAGRIEFGQCRLHADDAMELALRTPSGKYLRVSKVAGASSIRPFSYVRLVEMLGANQDAASVLTDSELRALMQNEPRDPKTAARLLAEIYFRAWLYEGASRDEMRAGLAENACHEIDHLLDGPLIAVRSQQDWTPDVADGVEMDNRTRAVWDRLAARIRSFIHADGIIPVVTGENAEAIPIAFTLRTNELPGTAIRDVAGIPMPLWKEAGEIFGDLFGQHIGVQLQCSTRGTGRQFDGESFELAVVLSVARKRGILPDYPTLAVMASGAIREDTVAPVLGIDAKLSLARKMGVKVFVTSGVPDHEVVMVVPAGTTTLEIIRLLTTSLERAGLDRLDTRAAAERLNTLGDDIHLGTVSMSDAAVRLDRYEKMLEQDTASRIATEGLIRAKVLRGAIANHSGNPQAGAKATQEAATLAVKLRMPMLYVNAMANRVVSLTDLGLLVDAESEGRHLLQWVLHEFSGSSAEQLQAEMVASGVLGGQALLQLALQDACHGPESLQLLSRALAIAVELRMPADICRDAAQIALWHALLAPTQTEAETEKARAILDEHHGEWSNTSQAHLQRIRLLGAYRAFLYHGIQTPGSTNWPLPEIHTASLNWVRATSQKYRGVLLARQGQFDTAEKDFTTACAILDRESAPLLRFIGATAALATGETLLGAKRQLAMDYLQQAQTVFSRQTQCFNGPVKGALWLQRTEGLLKGASATDLPNPQKCYTY
jgi:hypothetical protein